MTSRIDGSGGSLMVLGPEEMMAQMMIDANRENEIAEREAMRSDREAAAAAGELRLGQMEEAANFRLASGIVSGSVKVGSSITGGVAAISCTASSGAAGADGAAGESAGLTHEVSHSPAGAPDTTASDRATAIGGSVDGVSGAVTTLLDRLGSEADMRATRAETAADLAHGASEERRADAEAARRAIDRNLEVLGAISQDRRRAEEAATRA